MVITMRRNRPPQAAIAYLAAYFLLVTLMTGTLPSPLYSDYARDFGLSPLQVTTLFSAYAGAIAIGLLCWPRKIARLNTTSAIWIAIGCCALSDVIFATQPSYLALLGARVLSGAAVSVAMIASPALIRRHLPGHHVAAALISVATMFGLGSGALQTGLLTTFLPIRWLTYAIHPVLYAPLMLLGQKSCHDEPVSVMSAAGRLPPSFLRDSFSLCCICVFNAYAFFGIFAALSGSFLAAFAGAGRHLACGIVIFLVFAAASCFQLVIRACSTRLCLGSLLGTYVLALLLLQTAQEFRSLPLLLFTACAGGGVSGLLLKSSLTLLSHTAPQSALGRATSAFFLVAYIGLMAPVLVLGYLISRFGEGSAMHIYAAVVGVQVAVAAALLQRARPGLFAQGRLSHADH